jgi:DegV family protein with EDD domain
MGLGLLTIKTNKLAMSGMDLPQVVREVQATIPDIQMLGYLDTLKYLARGNRIGKARAWLGSLLNVKPMLTIRNGELEPAGQTRSQANGIERLVDFVKNCAGVQEMAIVYSTTQDEAQAVADTLGQVVGRGKIRVARLGPVLGVHAGPGILLVALMSKRV